MSLEPTYNAALNRPAYQSSLYSNIHGSFPANLANDGSRHTTYNTGTKCALTKLETNPWWAVDLGRPITVDGVNFTNRDAYGMLYSYVSFVTRNCQVFRM